MCECGKQLLELIDILNEATTGLTVEGGGYFTLNESDVERLSQLEDEVRKTTWPPSTPALGGNG